MDGEEEKKVLEKRNNAETHARRAIVAGLCVVCGGSVGAFYCTSIGCFVGSALTAIGSSILLGRELFRRAAARPAENTSANQDAPSDWPG